MDTLYCLSAEQMQTSHSENEGERGSSWLDCFEKTLKIGYRKDAERMAFSMKEETKSCCGKRERHEMSRMRC